MKSSLFFLSLSCFAALAWSQAASTPPSTTPPPSTQPQTTQTAPNSGSSLRARGPEAVAQQDPNRVVATIGGKQLTAKQALDLLKPLRPEDRKRFESNISSLVQQLYMTEQIADQATKLKLDQQ